MIQPQILKYVFVVLLLSGLAVYAGIVTLLIRYIPEIPKTTFSKQTNHYYQYLKVDSVNLRYVKQDGRRPYLVFMHGFASNLNQWNQLMTLFPEEGRVAFDIVGFGGSDRPFVDYTLDTQAHYMIDAMRKLNLGKVILVGHSMGGSLSARIAAEAPELISGLVLIAPSGLPGSLHFSWPASLIFKPGWINSLCILVARSDLFRAFYPDHLASQMLGVTGSYDRRFASLLGDITTPTLLFWSAKDARVLPEFKDQYMRLMPQIEFISLPDESAHTTDFAERIIADQIKVTFQLD